MPNDKFQDEDQDIGFLNIVNSDSELKPLDIPLPRPKKKAQKLIPVEVIHSTIKVDNDRKVIYRKIHRYDRKEFLIEISRTKIKYFIIAVPLTKKQQTQIIDFNFKKGKRLIKV